MSDESLLQVARIAASEFVMGAEDGDEDERPLHKAYVDDFAIGINPVTNAEYAQFVRATGHPSPAIRVLPLMVSGALESDFRSLAAAYFWNNGTPPEGRDGHPVTLVGFDDVLAYCGWLASKTSKPVRLPTEAEWERAARGGLDGKRFPWGDTLDVACAHFLPHATAKADRGTAPVGSYPANAFALHVWRETCGSGSPTGTRRSTTSARSTSTAGPKAVSCHRARRRLVNADGRYLRCAYRHKVPPDSYAYSIGFRVAYSLK